MYLLRSLAFPFALLYGPTMDGKRQEIIRLLTEAILLVSEGTANDYIALSRALSVVEKLAIASGREKGAAFSLRELADYIEGQA